MEASCLYWMKVRKLTVAADITPSNVLLQLKGFDEWSTDKIYQHLGQPNKEKTLTSSGQRPDSTAPEYLVEPASFVAMDYETMLIQVLLVDLGEAFQEQYPPPKGVGTPVWYRSPELMLENRASKASDIWALACTMFEMRSGFKLFGSFFGSYHQVLEEMTRLLGIPPEAFHPLLKQYGIPIECDKRMDPLPLLDHIEEIGAYDHESTMYDDERATVDNRMWILEPLGLGIAKDEAESLTDLLRRALNYSPEKRLSAKDMANHSWLVEDR